MAARGYEFYLRALNLSRVTKRTSERYFQREKIVKINVTNHGDTNILTRER